MRKEVAKIYILCSIKPNENNGVVLYPGIPFSIMNVVIPFDPAAKSVFA
jgi:hypothetical protein